MIKHRITTFLILVIITGPVLICLANSLNENKIKSFIENLAVSENIPQEKRQSLAFTAAKELEKYGKEALPYLLEHLYDKRESAAPFFSMTQQDVGIACFAIIQNIIFPLPEDYKGSFYRTGSDGKTHERPFYLLKEPFTFNTVKAWIKQREDKTIEEIQIEALQWFIETEKSIGFQQEEDKKIYLYPLEKQLEEIKKKPLTRQSR